eukprot:Rmarinus@m.21509
MSSKKGRKRFIVPLHGPLTDSKRKSGGFRPANGVDDDQTPTRKVVLSRFASPSSSNSSPATRFVSPAARFSTPTKSHTPKVHGWSDKMHSIVKSEAPAEIVDSPFPPPRKRRRENRDVPEAQMMLNRVLDKIDLELRFFRHPQGGQPRSYTDFVICEAQQLYRVWCCVATIKGVYHAPRVTLLEPDAPSGSQCSEASEEDKALVNETVGLVVPVSALESVNCGDEIRIYNLSYLVAENLPLVFSPSVGDSMSTKEHPLQRFVFGRTCEVLVKGSKSPSGAAPWTVPQQDLMCLTPSRSARALIRTTNRSPKVSAEVVESIPLSEVSWSILSSSTPAEVPARALNVSAMLRGFMGLSSRTPSIVLSDVSQNGRHGVTAVVRLRSADSRSPIFGILQELAPLEGQEVQWSGVVASCTWRSCGLETLQLNPCGGSPDDSEGTRLKFFPCLPFTAVFDAILSRDTPGNIFGFTAVRRRLLGGAPLSDKVYDVACMTHVLKARVHQVADRNPGLRRISVVGHVICVSEPSRGEDRGSVGCNVWTGYTEGCASDECYCEVLLASAAGFPTRPHELRVPHLRRGCLSGDNDSSDDPITPNVLRLVGKGQSVVKMLCRIARVVQGHSEKAVSGDSDAKDMCPIWLLSRRCLVREDCIIVDDISALEVAIPPKYLEIARFCAISQLQSMLANLSAESSSEDAGFEPAPPRNNFSCDFQECLVRLVPLSSDDVLTSPDEFSEGVLRDSTLQASSMRRRDEGVCGGSTEDVLTIAQRKPVCAPQRDPRETLIGETVNLLEDG